MVSLIIRLTVKALLALALSPLFAGYAAWHLGVWAVRLVARVRAARRLLAETIICPSCGVDNPLHGRFVCGACKAEYVGNPVACRWCSAGASHFPCCKCNAAIPLGLA